MDNWYKQAKYFIKQGYKPFVKIHEWNISMGTGREFFVKKGKKEISLNFFWCNQNIQYYFFGGIKEWHPRYDWIEKL